jgi:hypothetical protein
MADDSGIVIKRRDYSDIAVLQDPTVLEQFLDEPLTFIAESITGALAVGKTGTAVAAGRIVQAILKGQTFKQFAQEVKKLREAGQIPNDFAEKKYCFQTWVELMTIIDEESPDADRLEALKAMFFAVNQVGKTDTERIIAYQLWQIAKQLTSGELLLLKAVYEHRTEYPTTIGSASYVSWANWAARQQGHTVVDLIGVHERKLTELGLLSPREAVDKSMIMEGNARVTSLGEKFCENLKTYVLAIESE